MRTEGTTERVLRLLGLLQHRSSWTADELATELDVTPRSVRRDVERLRTLGYPVEASPGVGGGYRLGAGTRLPPLLLDAEEATATALSLRLAAGGTVTGVGDAALRALTKLDQVLPPRLRAEVHALYDATGTVVGPQASIDADVLVRLARACHDSVRVRFRYTARDGDERERTVEPVRMVTLGPRWYLMAYDVDRADWRTFRLDRMSALEVTTWRVAPREHPDPVEYVQRSVTVSPYRYLARVRLRAPADEVRALVPAAAGRVEEDTDGWCVLVAGAEDLDWLAIRVALLGLEAEVVEPPELRETAARLAGVLAGMAGRGDAQEPGTSTGADDEA
ncbi:helix-turn-helix transcriptional regulator [Georgenia sp. Z1491]|uniref:helix-turn-helix transcriptional regulator n=1 Tax=Georgenia sp. Z1491 TaxID=3416707 RepID=UPI003CF7FB34